MQERLHDADVRRRIREFIDRDSETAWSAQWDDQLIVKVNRPEARALIGKTIGEISRERGTEPLDTALDLVIEEGQFWVAPIIKRQSDLDQLLSHPLGVPVTDGMASHPVKHRDLGIMPKTFGSFPQILGRYVRDAGVMSLEHAIHQMTQVPAERVGIRDRAVLADGLRGGPRDLRPGDDRQPRNRGRRPRGPTRRHRARDGQRPVGGPGRGRHGPASRSRALAAGHAAWSTRDRQRVHRRWDGRARLPRHRARGGRPPPRRPGRDPVHRGR